MNRVADLLGEDAIAALQRPLEAARALPPAAYVDADFFALERKLVFHRNWIGIAFGHDIPAPGDAMPVEAAGLPLILVRDRAGEVRAFHNVCRHRGSALLSEPVKGQPTLRCPYHGWAYGLDGRLRATPLWDGQRVAAQGALDRGSLGLATVRCGVWADVVFVDLSGTAPPLAEFVRPLAARWRIITRPSSIRACRHASTPPAIRRLPIRRRTRFSASAGRARRRCARRRPSSHCATAPRPSAPTTCPSSSRIPSSIS